MSFLRKKILMVLGSMLIGVLVNCEGGMELKNDPGENSGANNNTNNDSQSSICTDPLKCCTKEKQVCYGNIDGNSLCFCPELWDCSKNPDKCEQDKQVPGSGTWACTWNENGYQCVKNGKKESPPEGGSGWNCEFSEAKSAWVCNKTFPPNPENKPEGSGSWQCVVDNELNKIYCEKKTTPTPTHNKEDNCTDGLDNDGDTHIDCMDPDCPCFGNQITCLPGEECCDGKDNDGDGLIDEGNVCQGVAEPCPPGAIQICDCYCGVHRRCQLDGTWGPCLVDDSCNVAQITSHSQCGHGSVCDYGECVPDFDNHNQCVHHMDCPTGQVCDLGSCGKDHYTPHFCY